MSLAANGAKVSLFFRCQNFGIDGDNVSVVIQEYTSGGKFIESGQTESTKGSSVVAFNKAIRVDYLFEMKQQFRATLVRGSKDVVARVDFFLSHIMSCKGLTKKFPAIRPAGASITVTAVDHSNTREDTVVLQFGARDLASMNLFGSGSDTYIVVRRLLAAAEQSAVIYQSEVVAASTSPVWKQLPLLRLADLMGRNCSENTVELEIFHKGMCSDVSLGKVVTSVDVLKELRVGGGSTVCSPQVLKLRSSPTGTGCIDVLMCDITHSVSFVNFLSGGWQMNLITAVDFTASNGDPRDVKSLHHFTGDFTRPNEYLRAIMAVGDIVLEYDTDKMIAAVGYGAELPDRRTSHFFHLNLTENPYVPGITGLVEAYQKALSVVKLSGPTYFAPLLQNVLTGVRQAEKDHIYTILLILTDGEITDIDDTIDALVQADDVALSIIIVGVGKECDFKAMVQLDGDNGALIGCNGRVSRRDLVQFVPMRDFVNRPAALLAAEVLREVPSQVERWAAIKGITLDSMPAYDPTQSMSLGAFSGFGSGIFPNAAASSAAPTNSTWTNAAAFEGSGTMTV